MQQDETGPHLTSYTKRKSKWFKNLNSRPEIIKSLEENIGCKLLNIGHADNILNLTTKAKRAKAKINKWNDLKLKIFCIAKKTINRKKRQLTEWKGIFANRISNNNQYIKNSHNSIANHLEMGRSWVTWMWKMPQCMANPPASSTTQVSPTAPLKSSTRRARSTFHLCPAQFCVVRCSPMTTSSPWRVLATSCPATVVLSVAISSL